MNIRVYDHSFHEVVSGGDVIAAEFTRAWNAAGHTATVSISQDAVDFFRLRGIASHQMTVARILKTDYKSVLLASLAHILNAVIDVYKRPQLDAAIIFAGSWSLQDLLPALIDAHKHPRALLVVGCYIFLLPPWRKTYGSNLFNRWVFWLEYLIGITLMRLFADTVWTASPVDATYIRTHWHKRATAIRGGADIKAATQARLSAHEKVYDAVYIGRFHPQKNITELVDIWKLVTRILPRARLAIAGAGFLKGALRQAITDCKLEKNISLLDQIDGTDKFNLLVSSRMFISSSHYDTGNLALDEALACGVPGVAYNLRKIVYPKGVILVKLFDVPEFSEAIIRLLRNPGKRADLGRQARSLGVSLDWNTQAAHALDTVLPYIAQ